MNIKKLIKETIENNRQPEVVDNSVVDNLKGDINNLLRGFQNDLLVTAKEHPEMVNNTQNEGVMTTAGIVLAVPAILGLISKLGKLSKEKFSKLLGKKPTAPDEMDKWLEKMGSVADQLHHLYLVPVEKIVGMFVKDKTKAHKISNVILHVIIAVFCLSAGVTAVNAIHSKNISLSLLESCLSAIKGGELNTFLTNIFKH